ncbi:MAG: arginine repressor [Bacillota bacterium]|jgi:transcriptional regulator of arginine metabolism|nr:arginine repressor [Bacillota bacterium]MDD3298692.1 arginine repressor [Bacillota bacterium]MDD3850539.1 arginine repressor [Bacillota bacterium]MDD4707669.1 arginine repressor [Bacillota bacterium]
MKIARHAKILELIENKEIETQEELAEELKTCGFNITQATVSRDIKELRLIKILSDTGKYKYATIKAHDSELADRHVKVFIDSVLKVDYATNMVVMKTIPGAAQGAAAAIDALDWSEVVGTIAGDDTIFVLTRSEKNAVEAMEKLKKLIV